MWDTSSSQSRYSLHSTGTFGGWVVGMSLLGRSFKRTFREIWREEEEEGRREVSAMAPAKPGKARKGQADEAWRLLEWSTVEGQTSAAAEEEERRGARKEAAEERGQMKREETLRKLLNTAE